MLKLFRQLRPFAGMIAGVLVLVFIQSMSDLYLPTLMSDIIDTGVVKRRYELYFANRRSYAAHCGDWGSLFSGCQLFFFIEGCNGVWQTAAQTGFSRVEAFSLQEFDKIGTASLITRTTNDITQVQQVLVMLMRMVLSAPIMFVGGVIMAVTKDAKLSLVIVAIIPIFGFDDFPCYVQRASAFFKVMQTKTRYA
ncbi:hypothetical protein GCM10020331_069970 [Ectobacillus funiculus]